MVTGKPKREDREYNNWGGKRQPGPGRSLGRPAIPANEKQITISVSLPPWLARWLVERKTATKESTSAAVERALVGFYGLEGPEGEAEK